MIEYALFAYFSYIQAQGMPQYDSVILYNKTYSICFLMS